MALRLTVLFPLLLRGGVDNDGGEDSDFADRFKAIRAERFKMPRQRKHDPERLTTLEQQLERVQRAIRREKAQQKQDARAEDSHRKIVAGALALEHFAKNPNSEFGRTMFRLLDEYTRPHERYLFEFLPKRDLPPATQDNQPGADEPDKLNAAE
jgi:hypothetical protein